MSLAGPRLAQALLGLGTPSSAAALLRIHPGHGPALNRLRARADRLAAQASPKPGVHALGVVERAGIAVPLRADRGLPSLDAERAALALCRELLREPTLPSLALLLPEGVALVGASLGLPGALAFLARYVGREPRCPVFATAELGEAGTLLPVAGAREKLAAAHAELCGRDGLVLVHPANASEAPEGLAVRAVSTLAEAAALVFPDGLRVDPNLRSFDRVIDDARAQAQPEEAVARLRAFDARSLPAADRARYLFELGIQLRHAGDAAGAGELHRSSRALLGEVANVLGPVQLENLELEALATAIDQYAFVSLERELRARLAGRFELTHHRVRCRGMLAQVLSSLGSYREAIALRHENLRAQQESLAMRAELPRTRCHLLRDLARAGEHAAVEEQAALLLDDPHAGEPYQVRYNDWALLFALVRLGRSAEALAWVRGARSPFRAPPGAATVALVDGTDPITHHPEVSTARVLIRALRREGASDRAGALAERLTSHAGRPLVTWLAELGRLEGALGSDETASAPLAIHAHRLREAYSPAAAFHGQLVALLECPCPPVPDIEDEIDAVYY
ncbi:MAG: hypothetical protein IT371_11975 [Deltaproteobacteria bacterium]|nr:hypothetical protein [Deltaproteobacteria bacterium]